MYIYVYIYIYIYVYIYTYRPTALPKTFPASLEQIHSKQDKHIHYCLLCLTKYERTKNINPSQSSIAGSMEGVGAGVGAKGVLRC